MRSQCSSTAIMLSKRDKEMTQNDERQGWPDIQFVLCRPGCDASGPTYKSEMEGTW
jgi:hypothetical protein